MRENRDERYSGFSGWLRKNRTALRNCGIAAAVIGTGLAVWYGAGMYQHRKAEEAMIAARHEMLQETGAEMTKEAADSGMQTGKEKLFEGNTVSWDGKTYKRNTYVKAVLCMGVDRDGPMTETTLSGDGGQADGIFLLANDTARGSMKILLIPRDTMTEITKTDISWTDANGTELGQSVDHLSLSYAYGDGREKSCEYTKQAVSHLLMGLEIDSYMAADLEIIASLNDEVGGVSVTIPTIGMEKADPEFVFGKTVRLKGEQAERFVRFRDIERDNSAISRMEQQKLYISGFFQAVKEKSKTESSITEKLFEMSQDYMVTDMAKDEYLKLAINALEGEGLTSSSFKMAPGTGTATETYDEYYVDQEALVPILLDLFYREA
jgi:LCP family protein required for cell wall assembly